MLPIDDYREVFELISQLAPDFMAAAVNYKFAPAPDERRDFETKAAYIQTMYEVLKTLNSVKYNTMPQQQKPFQQDERRREY